MHSTCMAHVCVYAYVRLHIQSAVRCGAIQDTLRVVDKGANAVYIYMTSTIYMCVYVYVCVYMCVYVYVCVYMFTVQ